MELNESQTRSLLINPKLHAAGWKLSDRSPRRDPEKAHRIKPARRRGLDAQRRVPTLHRRLYRQIEQDEVFYEKPAVTIQRMRQLEKVAESEITALEQKLAAGSAIK